jgi:hypothetical protein
MKTFYILVLFMLLFDAAHAHKNNNEKSDTSITTESKQKVIMIKRIEAFNKWALVNDSLFDYYSMNGWDIENIYVNKAKYDSLNTKEVLINFNSWVQSIQEKSNITDTGKVIYIIKQRY